MLLYTTDTPAPEIVEVYTDKSTGNRSLFSKTAFRMHEIISDFYWTAVYPEPSYLTVQIDEAAHIALMPSFLACINHSCQPNSFFDIEQKQLVCIKPISTGEEITFFYPSSEWCMNRPFDCDCASPFCLHHIAGAKYLSPEQQKRYRFTPFIQKKLATAYGLSS